MAVPHHPVGAGVNNLVGLGSERRRSDRGLSRGVGGLAGQAEHQRWGLLGGLGGQLEVGRHERVLRGHRGLDGGGHSDDGGLRGHAVVVRGWLQGVGVRHEAGLAHGGGPRWPYGETPPV